MKSKYSHVLMLLAAIAAFMPVLAVDFLLDSYVRMKERAALQASADAIAANVQAAAYDSINSLRRILDESPSLCTPSFLANVHRQMGESLFLREVLVENADGVQYCDALAKSVSYSVISKPLSIPNHPELLEVAHLEGLSTPVLKVTQTFGDARRVSAFAPVVAATPEALLAALRPTSMVRLSLSDGTEVMTAGDGAAYDGRGETEYLTAQSFAGELPLQVTSALPFAMARADYADLDASFTVLSCLMCGAFLALALQYVRRSDLPAFDLERAIAAGELKPYYQPVINLRTGALAGCEVLCRWEKKNGEIVPPGAFIDFAEITGLAVPMTVSLMQQVRADLGELCREMPDLKVSINLFEGHFRDGNLIDDVQAIFGGSAISFRQLVFEITERQPLDKTPAIHSVIGGLHALGCRVAMDDAGTGHSNLAYLQTLGIDVIKIDRVFTEMIRPGATQVPVLDGLIAMARDLGTEIVVEGVETEDQALYLRARGVLHAQGHLFAPALRVGAFRELAVALKATGRTDTALPSAVGAA